MLKILTAVILGTSLPFIATAKDVFVQGYTKSNGTYVPAYYRTAPNSTKADNYSTQGNINPYTGKAGTKPIDDSNPSASENSDEGSEE